MKAVYVRGGGDKYWYLDAGRTKPYHANDQTLIALYNWIYKVVHGKKRSETPDYPLVL